MSIWKRIILGFISVIAVMTIVDTMAVLNNIQIMNRVNNLEQSKRVELTESNKVAYTLQYIKSNLRELLLEMGDNSRPEEIAYARYKIKSNIPDLLLSLKNLNDATETDYLFADTDVDEISEEQELVAVSELDSLTTAFINGIDEILRLMDDGKLEAAEDYFENDVEPITRIMQTKITAIADDAANEVELSINYLNARVKRTVAFGIYLAIFSSFIALVIGLFISKSISNPIHKLIDGAEQIEEGNLDFTVDIETKGELQQLATSFNSMTKELRSRINDINRLNADLQESNKTKDKYFSIIAHDLKNPFNAILGFTGLLNKNYHDYDEKKRQQIIRELSISSKVIYDLLENLLNWARAQNGTISLRPKTLNLNRIVSKSISSSKGNAEHKKIKLFNYIPEDLDIYVDEFTMTAVINNILNNAIKFTPNKGLITIAAAVKETGQVELSIKDTGVGMTQETIDNLFQSKEIESTLGTQKEKGTGLGLVLIKDFIEKNNCTFAISSSPGLGTEFKISFPVDQEKTT